MPTPSHGKRKNRKARLDVLLLERGLVESRRRAQAHILAGEVTVNGQRVTKAGTAVPADARIEITGEKLRYASRAGLKLEGALEDFAVAPSGRVCLDAGASTGGFTDCLLQHGAKRVYAVDVTTDQLAWRLQKDSRVVRIEKNIRYLTREDVGEPVELITLDLSFISTAKVLPYIVALAKAEAELLILVKPQFELERKDVGQGGIVRDAMLHRKAVDHVRTAAEKCGWRVLGERPSRITGAEGNQEFFLHARREPVE